MRFFKPRYKLYKREGIDLFLKNRSFLFKKKKKNFFRKKIIENKVMTHYHYQLLEKRKLKIIYGITEKKLIKYFIMSKKIKNNLFSENMLILLESRLDNMVYRLGFASTRAESRQLVSHKCVLVNKKLCNIPSYNVLIGDIVSIRLKCRQQFRIINSLNYLKKNNVSYDWIYINYDNYFGYMKRYPFKSDLDIDVDENLVYDYCSR